MISLLRSCSTKYFVLAASLLMSSLACAQTCAKDAPVAPPTGAEHSLPDGYFFPIAGNVMMGTTAADQTQGQVRAVGFSVMPKPITLLVNRTYVPPPPGTGLSGSWQIGLSKPGGPPPRVITDGWELLGAYNPATSFKYRLEFCENGKWVTITAPETKHTLAFSDKYKDDVYTVTYGSRQDHPSAQNLLTTVIFSFKPPELEVHVDVSKSCVGIPGAAAYSSGSVHGWIRDHWTGHATTIQNLGVSMIFDGTTQIVPKPGHGSLNYPGTGEAFNSGQGYVDTFPYGEVSKAEQNTSSVNLDDKVFAVRIGGACRDFTGVVRAIMYDGQVVVATQHNK